MKRVCIVIDFFFAVIHKYILAEDVDRFFVTTFFLGGNMPEQQQQQQHKEIQIGLFSSKVAHINV